MIYFLALFGLAYAQQKKQCLANVLAGVPGKVFNACDDISKVNALEADIRACKVQLGNCDGGGEEGGKTSTSGAAQALLVKYGAEQFNFAFTSDNPVGAAYDAIHDLTFEHLTIDEDHDITFDYNIAAEKVSGKVENDQQLEEAVNLATAMGTILTLTVHKTTLSPTPAPLEPWGAIRYVKQIQSGFTEPKVNLADGRDNGPVNYRILDFSKMAAATGNMATTMRLHYEDNLRVHNNGANCYWELYVAGKRCPGGFVRGAMHSSGNQNNDHQTSTILGLCHGLAKTEDDKKHRMTVQLYGNNRDCYSGWDPESKGFMLMEAKEVRVGMYGYYGLTDRSKARGEDNMFPILGRVLEFTKEEPHTWMRLVYADNFRVYGGGSCRWFLRVDDKVCGEQKNQWIASSIHTRSGDNDHLNQAFTGYCGNVAAGKHILKAGVQGSNDCYTGWEGSFHLEAEEVVALGDSGRTFFQRTGNNADGRDNGLVTWRVMNFKKNAKNSIMRMLYSDVLRVHGHGKWCKWEIKVDGKPCKENLSGNRYVVASQDDHTPGQIVGYCLGLDLGEHQMTISVRGNGADCYTGWDRQSQGSFLMEAIEMPAVTVIGKANGL